MKVSTSTLLVSSLLRRIILVHEGRRGIRIRAVDKKALAAHNHDELKCPIRTPPPSSLNLDRTLAFTHYDTFYTKLYKDKYLDIFRPALLSRPHYVALPNPHVGEEVDKVIEDLRGLGAKNLRDYEEEEGVINTDRREDHVIPVTEERLREFLQEEDKLFFPSDYYGSLEAASDYNPTYLPVPIPTLWPEPFKPHLFPLVDSSSSPKKFPRSTIMSNGCSSTLFVNGGSIMPVVALDLNPSVNLLDICAGPGTKSLMALISSSVNSLTCNDLKPNRVERTIITMKHFTGEKFKDLINYTVQDGRSFNDGGKTYDRILVDIPCSNDRASLRVENNIFKKSRWEERQDLYEMQKQILKNCLKLGTKNGIIVYSTCTLSPPENDGVVLNALRELEGEEEGLCFALDLQGMIELMKEYGYIFRFSVWRCGILIEPMIGRNFGPMYISRIVRL